MSDYRDTRWSRREFLGGLALAGTAGLPGVQAERPVGGLLGSHSRVAAAEPPPETTTLRLGRSPGTICVAPAEYAAQFLPSEGFTNVQYISAMGMGSGPLAAGGVDFDMGFVGPWIREVDAGAPIVMLAGQQIGCFMLFVTDRIRTIRDMKGTTVASGRLGSGEHLFLASLLASVGLDARKDVNLVDYPPAEATRLLAEGRLDAYNVFAGIPPTAQELQAKRIGRVLVNTMTDRPWSQYFCCMLAGNREFVRKNPVATKRAMRGMLKATDVTAREPDRVARFLVSTGHTDRYDYALQILREIPYAQWREFDPEDTVRFYALRLHEVGLIKKSPPKVIAEGTDWRLLKELKKEMKG